MGFRNILFLIILFFKFSGAQTYYPYTSLINSEYARAFLGESGRAEQFMEPGIIQKNKVKNVIIMQYKDDGGAYESTKHEFDTSGLCTKEFVYKIDYKTLWKYDLHKNVIEEIDSTSKKIRHHQKFIYKYDERGNIKSIIAYALKDTCVSCVYRAERSGKLDCQDTCVFKVTDYLYDSLNRMIKLTYEVFYSTRHEKVEFTYQYNKLGQLIQKKEFNKWKYSYDKKGNMVKREEYFSNDVLSNNATYYKYDRKKRLKAVISGTIGESCELEEFTYDRKGLLKSWTLSTGIYKKQFKRYKYRFKRYFRYAYF